MFNQCCVEPSLDELFDDLTMQLLMRRDGVTRDDIRVLLREVKDFRAAAVGRAKRKHFADMSPGRPTDRGGAALSSREADKLPIRFI